MGRAVMPSDVEPEDLFARREWARAVGGALPRAVEEVKVLGRLGYNKSRIQYNALYELPKSVVATTLCFCKE